MRLVFTVSPLPTGDAAMGLIIASDGMRQRQSLPLDAKIIMTKQRIKAWYEHWDGEVYVSFSGGKDSTVLAELVWSMYPNVPALFSNTGLEYPEIVQFVKKLKAQGRPIVITRPQRTFRDVLLTEGFPLASKKVAEMVRRLRQPRTKNNDATHNLYLTGYRRDGVFSKNSKLPNKWLRLIDAPFKTSERCCDVLKKDPFKRYQKETGRKPFTGVMSDEGGGGRRATFTQCNLFDVREPQSRPMLFWTEENVWEYIRSCNLDYCSIYDDRVIDGVVVEGEKRTGCMFCVFGAHLEKGPNRFQRMAVTHPKQWDYCINKLGMGEALDFIGVQYRPVKV